MRLFFGVPTTRSDLIRRGGGGGGSFRPQLPAIVAGGRTMVGSGGSRGCVSSVAGAKGSANQMTRSPSYSAVPMAPRMVTRTSATDLRGSVCHGRLPGPPLKRKTTSSACRS
eukprot:scaffold8580_cov102-Isochrysis_galbana.AAC.7